MNKQITEASALAEFKEQLEETIGPEPYADATPKRRRPRKLDREATRTAVAHCRFGSKRDRDGKRIRAGATEFGACSTFDRGPALTRAIANATRRGRVSKEAT